MYAKFSDVNGIHAFSPFGPPRGGPRAPPKWAPKGLQNEPKLYPKWIHLGDPAKAPSQNVTRLSRDCPAPACDFHDSPWEPFLGQRAAGHQQWSLRGDAVDVEVFAWGELPHCYTTTGCEPVPMRTSQFRNPSMFIWQLGDRSYAFR